MSAQRSQRRGARSAGREPAPTVASPISATTRGARALLEVPRPHGRDLDERELATFASDLADRPELWIELVRHDATQRIYHELLRDDHLATWLICWMDDHDTGFHDHDISAGAVAVVSGAVREERLAIDGPTRDRVFAAGHSFGFSACDIHRVRHAGVDPAVTLHVYSPPLVRMGAYAISNDGVLARHTISYEQELRQLGAAA